MALVLLSVSCGQQQPSSLDNQEQKCDTSQLRIAVMPTVDCLPLYVASERGFFKKEGLDVSLLRYQAQMDCDTSFLRGHANAIVTDLVRAQRMVRVDSAKLTYITATNASWQLLYDTLRVKLSLSNLDDKMIAMTRFSATHLLSDTIVEKAKLLQDRVYRVQFNDLNVRLSMFFTGTMDAMLLPEPHATAARNRGAKVFYNSADADLWFGVIAIDTDALKTVDTGAFKKAYDEACDSLNEYGVKGYASIAEKYCAVSRAVVDSLPAIQFKHSDAPRQKDVNIASQWLMKKM